MKIRRNNLLLLLYAMLFFLVWPVRGRLAGPTLVLPQTDGDTIPFDSCHQARPFCGNHEIYYTGGIIYGPNLECYWNSGTVPFYETCCIYNCHANQGVLMFNFVNPIWWFFKPTAAGILELSIYFIKQINGINYYPSLLTVFGPYSHPTSACLYSLDSLHVVGCNVISYSPITPPTLVINNLIPGKYYMILSEGGGYQGSAANPLPFEYHIEQVNRGQAGAAVLDCGMVYNCTILEMTATVSACNPQSNTFGVTGQLYFTNPPPSGQLVIWDNVTNQASIIQAPFESPIDYSLWGLPCDNQQHIIHASFWDSVGCEYEVAIQAPILCPQAVISGGGSACDEPGTFVPVYIHFPVNADTPYVFVYSIDGIPQPADTTSGPFPVVIYAHQPGLYILDTVYNAFCAGQVSGQAQVVFYPLPQPDLGTDIHACEGRPVTLDAGPGYTSYMWNTGDPTRTLEVIKAGTYQVWVTDVHNCSGTDEINVEFIPKPATLLIKHN